MNKFLQPFLEKMVRKSASAKTACSRLFLLMVLFCSSAVTGFGQIGIDFRQYANDDNPNKWINSILQQNNSAYYEGTSVPQRLVFVGVPQTTGNVHKLLLSHQTLKGSIHAYDFITGYDQALTDYQTISSNALVIDVSGANIGPQATTQLVSTLFAGPNFIRADAVASANYGSLGGDNVASRVAAYDVIAGANGRKVQIYGSSAISSASLTFLGYSNDAVTGDDYANYELTWVSASENILILMAGHLALGPANPAFPGVHYGEGKGSSAISGGPYHFKLSHLDGVSLGAQDNQIKGSDILIPPPPCTITPSTNSICTNTTPFSVQYSGPDGMDAYAWTITPSTGVTTNGLTGQTLTITGAPAGSYTIQLVTTRSGKQSVDDCTASLTVYPAPQCSITGGPQGGGGLCVSGAGLPQPTYIYTGPAGMSSYKWTISGPGTIEGADNQQAVTIKPSAGGDITLSLTITNENNCSSNCSLNIPVLAQAPCDITGPTSVCQGSGEHEYDGGEGASIYAWTIEGNGTISGPANQQKVKVNAGAAGSYTLKLTVTNPNSCVSNCQYQVTVNPLPVCGITGDNTICAGESTSFTASGGTSYSWTGPNGFVASGATINNITVAGKYEVTVTDGNGCSSKCDVTLVVNPLPQVTANDATLCADATIQLTGSPAGGSWSGSYVDANGLFNAAGLAAGQYVVTYSYTDANGCTNSDEATVTVENCNILYCSYTQGYFGNAGGTACTPEGPSTTLALITNSIGNMPGMQLYLGKPGRSLTIPKADAAKIIDLLPGGGASVILGGDYTWSTVPKKGKKLNNTLLAQTITLTLNVYMPGSDLGSFSLADGAGKWMINRENGGSCADPEPADCKFEPIYTEGVLTGYQLVYNSYQGWYLSEALVNALGGNKTVADLLKLASDALGGEPLPAGVTLGAIADAAAAINEGFDECRYFVKFADTNESGNMCVAPEVPVTLTLGVASEANSGRRPATNEQQVQVNKLTITTYPNPFVDQLNFRFVSPVSGRATLEVINMYGQRLGIVFDGQVKAGVQNFVNYRNAPALSGMLMYKLTVGDQTVVGKVQSIK